MIPTGGGDSTAAEDRGKFLDEEMVRTGIGFVWNGWLSDAEWPANKISKKYRIRSVKHGNFNTAKEEEISGTLKASD